MKKINACCTKSAIQVSQPVGAVGVNDIVAYSDAVPLGAREDACPQTPSGLAFDPRSTVLRVFVRNFWNVSVLPLLKSS